uniref:Uncharacterized protein n=2 Tax=Caenorhabditis japonica TaxID=281687 RepID=A0A8R1ETS4_CAEJA
MLTLSSSISRENEEDKGASPDADELFNRKLRFSSGEDASKLPAAIATSGELCILDPQFSGKYQKKEQQYLPRPFRLPLESDNYRVKADERASMREREADRAISRHRYVKNGFRWWMD